MPERLLVFWTAGLLLTLWCALAPAPLVLAVSADAPLIVGYFHLPPYYLRGTPPRGILLDRIARALSSAGIPYLLVEMPINRILLDVKQNAGPFCSAGWFKTMERERFALFSRPIFRNGQTRVLVRMDESARFIRFKTLAELIDSREFCPGLARSFSYGETFDSTLRERQKACRGPGADHNNLLKMLKAHRFDYVLMAPEEIEALAEFGQVRSSEFHQLIFEDVPVGNLRYVMCSKKTDEEVIARLNHELEKFDLNLLP